MKKNPLNVKYVKYFLKEIQYKIINKIAHRNKKDVNMLAMAAPKLLLELSLMSTKNSVNFN